MARARAALNVSKTFDDGVRLCGREHKLEGVVINDFELCATAERPLLDTRSNIFVFDVIIPPERDVSGIEGIAVRPLHPLDKVHGQLGHAVVPLPALGKVRQRSGLIFGFDLPTWPLAHETLLDGHIDTTPALMLTGHEVEALGATADHMTEHTAIFTDPVRHRRCAEHERLGWESLFNRRQLPVSHERIKERRLRITVERTISIKIGTANKLVF